MAYALYVLARNGRPVIGDLRYLSDAKLESFATPLGKAQLAGALAMLGDRARAAKAFGAALDALEAERDKGVSRPDYGSRLRDAAAVLALLAEANLGSEIQGDAIARAGAVLEAARAGRSSTSTQEMNWMALAAEALAEQGGASQFSVDGEPVKGALYRRFSGAALASESFTVANAGRECGPACRFGFRRAGRARPRRLERLCDRAFVLQARRNQDRFFAQASRRTSAWSWRSK